VSESSVFARHNPLPDGAMSLLAIALVFIGLVAISSASIEYADRHHADAWFHTQRHLAYLALALAGAFVVYRIDLDFWLDSGGVWLFLALALLIIVLIPGIGHEVNGSQRWLLLAGFTLQPSECAKLAMVVYLAGYMVRREEEVREHWRGFLKPLGLLLVAAVLLLAEPDFGATVIIAMTTFGMLFLAGVRLWNFLIVLALAVGAMAVLVVSEPYRVKRLLAYIDPWRDPYDTGFQLTQSLIAFGRGEWLGVGLGNSIQKLFYLPEAHTDFVFSIWAEETGFVGSLVVMMLFAALVWRIMFTGRRALLAGNAFGAHLCHGVALIFAGQAFVNMGVSSGLLPTKGLTLPFVSYGGNSLIICCAMLGLVLRVDTDTRAAGARGRRG